MKMLLAESPVSSAIAVNVRFRAFFLCHIQNSPFLAILNCYIPAIADLQVAIPVLLGIAASSELTVLNSERYAAVFSSATICAGELPERTSDCRRTYFTTEWGSTNSQ